MSGPGTSAYTFVTPEQRESILKLYNAGLYVQAYRQAEWIGPLAGWRRPESRVLAGRIAGNLGSTRLADWHFVHAWRENREHPETLWYFTRYLLNMRGPFAAWNFVRSHPLPSDAAPMLQSHWYSQQAAILGRLRDFDAAHDWLKKAEAIGEEPWTLMERAALCVLEDKHEEAEAAARKAMQLHPWYRPAVQWIAHFLVQKQRDDEALDLLTQATHVLESGAVFAQLASLQIELKRYDDAWRSIDDAERLSPLADKHMKQWIASRRCDVACYRGDFDTAIAQAKNAVGTDSRTRSKFYEGLVALLTNRADAGKRVELPVGFVQQHHRTCAPATLVSIAKFWTMPADHLEVAAEISYAGTPYHSQRKWAHEHGWITKEFTVTWDSAVALIDRGIPFTLATTEVTSAHLQAVVGYDSLRRTLILRDPGERHRVEIGFDLMCQRYRSTGPRGMAMVPETQKEKLAGLSLPDEPLYNHLHRMEISLQEHRREDAGTAIEAMTALDTGHFLTVNARRILAHYDADMPEELIQTERMLELFPGDLYLELARANILSVLGRYHERLAILKRLAELKESDPACWQQYAWELSIDARKHPQALYLLRRAARVNPMLARTYSTLARIKSMQRDFDSALELYHIAVCLEEKDEFVAQDYFMEARAQGKTEEAMEFLQRRCDRLGMHSSQPARTLYFALMQQDRYDDAFGVLENAMKLRPDDGELLTYSAEAHTVLGDFARAEELLEKANGVSKPAARMRSLAYLATSQGDSVLARERWAEVLKIEPIAEDAHRNYCLLLAEREGREAAIDHLQTVCERFPHHFGLTRMLYDWMLEDGPGAREKVLKRLIDIHPSDAWTHREYAVNLADQGKLDDAFQELFEAEPLEPTSPYLWHTRAYVHKKNKKFEDAQFAYREAIRTYCDYEPAILEMIQLCSNLQERRDVVAFVEQELIRQGTYGNGILALRDAAMALMPPVELMMSLRRIMDLRPDLWQAWSTVVRQLIYMDRWNDALDLAQRAIQRFPLYAAGWFDLAEARRCCKDLDGEIAALKRCVELSPTWDIARKWLVDAFERAGDLTQAKEAVQQAIKRAPLVGATYVEYAELLWRNNEYDEAVKQVRHGLRLDPGIDQGWNDLVTWCNQLDRYNIVFEVARDWTSRRRGEARSWLRLGQAHNWQPARTNADDEAKRVDDCVAAYDEALKRNPTAINIYDLNAQALAFAGRYEEARKSCNPPFYKGKPPIELRGRAAWVYTQEGDFDTAKKQMVPLLKEDPLYTWGWNEILNWCLASGQYKEYYDAACDMMRQLPQSAMALTYRGEAQLRMDDRGIGLDDLRAAYRKDPCNSLCAFLLFDEQMADEDFAGAEATMTVMAQSLAGDFVRARQIQLAGRKGHKDLALEKWQFLVVSRNPVTWPLDVSARALDLAGWKPEAERIVLDAMSRPNWDTHLAFIYATWWNPNVANDLPDRIAAIDRALVRLPGDFRFLDLKAELLTNGAQFEQAWQTCKEKTYPKDQYALDGRAAWVMWRSGRVMEAIFEMRKLVKQFPNYYWGWMQLADWQARQQQWVDVLTMAEELVRLNPRDPNGYFYRAWAKENLNDPQAARADYLYAFDLQPWYIAAAWQLFNMYVRGGEWQRAEKILEKTKKYADPGEWALRKVDLVVYQNKKGAFPADFEHLCRNSAKMPNLLYESLRFIVPAGWWGEAEAVLHRCLDLGAHICDYWVQYRVAMGDTNVDADIDRMALTRPERTNCVAAYAVELAYQANASALRQWAVDHEEELRADTPSWAKVGFAFSVAFDWTGVIEWMTDWQEHAKATPAQLLPLVRAHRVLGNVEKARRVSGHALTKLPPDFAVSFHKVWLMFDQALEGESDAIQRYLETADLGGFDGYHQMVSAMVRSLWIMQTDKETGFARARQLLYDTAAYALPTVSDPALSGAYQLCVAEVARLEGTIWAKLWRWWRWLVPTLPQPPQPPPQ